VTKKKALNYRGADRAGKFRILDQLVELAVHRRAGRGVTVALAKCWALLRAPASKHLTRMLALVVMALLRRDGELDPTDADAALLVHISAATIDRRRVCPTRV
jgi:hypothetical protein